MNSFYTSLGEKPFDSHYDWREIDIAAPVSTVFARARHISEWMNAHEIVSIHGIPGEAGHFGRVFPRNLSPGTPEPRHHLFGIAYLVPDRFIGIEVFNERGGSYGKTNGWLALDGIIFTSLDSRRTRVAFLITDLHEGAPSTNESEARAAEMASLGDNLLVPYLRTLKQQAESDVLAAKGGNK
jgi:hypothetical protein